MKVKNIMFSGFMAVILSGVACSADAAGFQVASKQYVDAREDAIETAADTKYLSKDDAATTYVTTATLNADGGIAKTVEALDEAVNSTDTGLATKLSTADFNSYKTTNDAAVQKNAGDIAAMDAAYKNADIALSGRIDANSEAIALLEGGEGAEGSIANLTSKINANATAIETLNANAVTQGSVANSIASALGTYTTENGINGLSDKVTTLQGTVGDSTNGLVKDVADLQTALTETGTTGSAIKANTDAIAEMKDAETGILKQAQDYTDAEVKELADGAVATNTAAITKLDGDVTVEGSVKKQIQDASEATKTAYEAYALPKPTAECANTTCVLATDKNGQPYWTQLWMYGADGESATESNP